MLVCTFYRRHCDCRHKLFDALIALLGCGTMTRFAVAMSTMLIFDMHDLSA